MNRLLVCIGLGLFLASAHLAPGVPDVVTFGLSTAYLALVPGLTIAPHVVLRDPLSRGLLTVAISLSTAAVVSELLAICHLWQWWLVIMILGAVAVAGARFTHRPRHSLLTDQPATQRPGDQENPVETGDPAAR